MKRDLDLIREILLVIEENSDPIRRDLNSGEIIEKFSVNPNWTDDQVECHIEMASMAGLIDGTTAATQNGWFMISIRLSAYGHEYLDEVRDPVIWANTKSASAKVASVSLDIVKEIAAGLIRQTVLGN